MSGAFHRCGKRIRDFGGYAETACKRAGIPGMLFHDLRRTAVRRFERAGVARSVAMSLSGHLTESVYRRYDIVSEKDLRIAADALDRFAGKVTGKVEISGAAKAAK